MAEGFELSAAAEQELMRRYVRELPEKCARIDSLWERLKALPADRVALEDLSLHVHRIAGSAAPHGLPTLGEAARCVDRIITPLARGAQTPNGDALVALTPLMDRLRITLREAQGPAAAQRG